MIAALLLGGTEKLSADRRVDLGAVPVEPLEGDLLAGVAAAIERHRPEGVLDLSDEPILGYRERMLVAAAALAAGVRYLGADVELVPPVEGPPLDLPTLAVIGTGKRTGKTAIAGEAARVAKANGLDPVVVAMGRGGPPEPQVAEAGSVTLETLVELARAGQHAASDYLEDAITTGVTTIGARRCAGGLAGRPFVSNVRPAAELAVRRGAGLVLLEGSGAAVPPIPWDAGVLVCPADAPEEYLAGYLGPYRVLRSDLVVLTMGAGPGLRAEAPATLSSHVRRLRPNARIVVTDFVPVPLGGIEGRKVYFATTAPRTVGPTLTAHLQEAHGCTVVGVSHRLSDRAGLLEDLEDAPGYEVLLTELKAAAIDVAAEQALTRGAQVVFADNRAETLEGDGDLSDLLLETARLAIERAGER